VRQVPESGDEDPADSRAWESTEVLLDRLGLMRIQLEGLELLNQQSVGRIADIYAPNCLPTEDEKTEVCELMREVGTRRRHVSAMRAVTTALDSELTARGVRPQDLLAPLDDSTAEDDPDLCQFCLTNPREVEYKCCGIRGPCVDCAAEMRRVCSRCPYCRHEIGSNVSSDSVC